MASPPSSELRFRRLDGTPCAPREWMPLFLELPGSPAGWEGWTVTVNGEPRPVLLRRLAGQARCVSEWPESGAGRYRIRLDHPNYGPSTHEVILSPAKLREGALESLLQDLDLRLPYALAAALQRGGALAGLAFKPPGDSSPAAEFARLRHLIEGTEADPGLLALLRWIARDPHRVLIETVVEVAQERARRPHPTLLRRALYWGRQIDDEGRPLHLEDRRVEPSYDTYENRLLKLATEALRRRLVRLMPLLPQALWPDAEGLIGRLDRARREATFLDDVTLPDLPPAQVTQVLLRRSEYRALLALWQRLGAALEVRLDAVTLETPLQSVPALYELWGTLTALTGITTRLVDQGYRVRRQRLVRRLPQGPLVTLAQGKDAVAELEHTDGTEVRIHFQRNFGSGGAGFASLSFDQRPDLAVEIVRPDGAGELLILDPKYKVEDRDGQIGPKKEDIDKMHTYCDAIVHRRHGRVVRYAAILYPGPAQRFGSVISALTADPLRSDELEATLRVLSDRLIARHSRQALAHGMPS